MEDTEDASAVSRRLQQAYRDEYGDSEKSEDEVPRVQWRGDNPSLEGMTPQQKLAWANANAAPTRRVSEQPVTLEEIGVSPAELARMKPEKRLLLANAALAARPKKG